MSPNRYLDRPWGDAAESQEAASVPCDESTPRSDDSQDREAPVGLSCRVYRTEAGLTGVPTVEQLVQVLR